MCHAVYFARPYKHRHKKNDFPHSTAVFHKEEATSDVRYFYPFSAKKRTILSNIQKFLYICSKS